MLNSLFLSHPTCDTFPSQFPFPAATLGQVSAPKISVLPRMLSSFQLLSGCQGSCRDVMGWKEAKHQLGRDDFLSKCFYGNRKPKSCCTTSVLCLYCQPQSEAVPEGTQYCDGRMWWQPVARGTCPGTHLCWAQLLTSSWDTGRGGEQELCPAGREKEQSLGSLIAEIGSSDCFFPQNPFTSGFFFMLERPHSNLTCCDFQTH